MKQLSFILKYLKYLISSKTAHGIHSPFVFELYNQVIRKNNSYYSFEKIEQLRQRLLYSQKEIEVTDLGTGTSGKRTLAQIAERSLKSEKYGQLLFRLANHLRPETILELGTSLGISTAYLASAVPNAKIITIEGCPNISAEAKKNFESLGLKNIETVVGNFDTSLKQTIDSILNTQYSILDLVFFDGNHKMEPTLNYFNQCLSQAHNDSLFIFDDIHWSDEMEEAWEEIKKSPKVTVTIDLFFIGLVFFRKEQAKENFVIRY